jgi:N-acetylglutamate synthase-like GNAT family acetyltransferase
MASQIQIRSAQIEDGAAIAEVLRQSFAEFKSLYTEEGFAATTPGAEQIHSRMMEGPVWVALRDGAIVGTVAATRQGESVYVRGMAVLPSARGYGVGTRLIEQVETCAVEENVVRIFLSTTPFLDSAIRLYESAGFRRTDQGPHNLFGTPLFTMEKLIGK